MLILDVSVAAKWFLRDEKDGGADALLTQVASAGVYVPALFRWEIQSVLLGAERAHRIDPDDVDAALDALRDLPIVIEAPGEHVFSGSELHLARRYDLTPYDAAYLALAAGRASAACDARCRSSTCRVGSRRDRCAVDALSCYEK